MPGMAAGAEGDAVEPVSKQVGITDRMCLPSQNQENGLECVFGMMAVVQELGANAQDQRAMTKHERGECKLGGRIASRGEAVEELAVRKAGHGAALEEGFDLPDHRS
jgi:hypothetical protein